MLSSKKFLKKVASFLYMGTIFSMEKEVSIPDAAPFKLTRSEHYLYQTTNATHDLLVQYSQKEPLRGVVHNTHGKEMLSLLIKPTQNFNALKELYQSEEITVINNFLDLDIHQHTLLACFFQPNIIVNTKNKSWYALYFHKHEFLSQLSVTLLINPICRTPSEKFNKKFVLQDYGNNSSHALPQDTFYKGSLYIFDPNNNTPSNLVIGCIYNELESKECNTCYIGMYTTGKNDEFKLKYTLNNTNLNEMLKIKENYQKNLLFEKLYKNYNTKNANDILKSKDKQDTVSRIIIDDTQCIHQELKNTFTLSFLVRIYLSREIEKKSIYLPPLYVLLKVSSSIQESIYLNDKNWRLKLLQISKENVFFSKPIYFNTINKTMPSNRILSIQFDAHASEQRELLPQLNYKTVEQKEDYFQQSSAEKEIRNALIMGSSVISNNGNRVKNPVLPDCLPNIIKKSFTKAKETLNKAAKDQNVESVATELSNIIDDLEEICNELSLELAFQKGLHNSLVEKENSLLQITNKHIDAIKEASWEQQAILINSKTTIKEEIKKLESELTQVTQKLNGAEKEILADFQKQLDKTFTKLMDTFLTTFQKEINQWENTKSGMVEKFNQYKNSLDLIKINGEEHVKELKTLADNYESKLKNFDKTNQQCVELINKLTSFMSNFEEFKTSIEKKEEEYAKASNQKMNTLKEQNDIEKKNLIDGITTSLNGQITKLEQLVHEQRGKMNSLEQKITTLEKFEKKSESFNWRLNFCCLVALLACIKMGVDFMHCGYMT